MNKRIRDKCKVEIVECIHVKFTGKENKDGIYPKVHSDDGIVPKFYEFCMEKKFFSLEFGGCSGGGVYVYCHRSKHKKQITEFFKREGVKVKTYT